VKVAAKIPAKVTLIYVRNPDKLETGKIKGALNISVDVIGELLAEINKDKEIVLCCNSGTRAEMAHTVLNEKGLKNRYLDATVTFEDSSFEVEEN